MTKREAKIQALHEAAAILGDTPILDDGESEDAMAKLQAAMHEIAAELKAKALRMERVSSKRGF